MTRCAAVLRTRPAPSSASIHGIGSMAEQYWCNWSAGCRHYMLNGFVGHESCAAYVGCAEFTAPNAWLLLSRLLGSTGR